MSSVAQIESAARSGNRAAAYALATALCDDQPLNADGWLLSALLSDEPMAASRAARRAAQIEASPRTAAVMRWALDWRSGRRLPGSVPQRLSLLGRPHPRASRRFSAAPWLIAPVILVVALLWLLWPRPTAAERARAAGSDLWRTGDPVAAISKWEEAHRLAPGDEATTALLARGHMTLWQQALRSDSAGAMEPHLRAAQALLPGDVGIQNEVAALNAYIAGRDAVDRRNWAAAIAALEPLYQLDPAYLDSASLLAEARAGQQEERTARSDRLQRQLARSLTGTPGQMLRDALSPAEVYSNLPGQEAMPPAPIFANPTNKHIVVSINAQRMYVYENNQLIWDWIASTGEPARPTVPGRYRIQSKFENARSNVWELWMPYWQGLYWAGSVENGIHGQVVFDSGGNLWEGFLGTQITFGCVMVSDEHAAMLFQWADMGTPVSIQWDWNPAWLPDDNGDPIVP